jgi:hypothetical protein
MQGRTGEFFECCCPSGHGILDKNVQRQYSHAKALAKLMLARFPHRIRGWVLFYHQSASLTETHSGTYIEIHGLIVHPGTLVQTELLVSPLGLACDWQDQEQRESIVRFVGALQKMIRSLKEYYSVLVASPVPHHVPWFARLYNIQWSQDPIFVHRATTQRQNDFRS